MDDPDPLPALLPAVMATRQQTLPSGGPGPGDDDDDESGGGGGNIDPDDDEDYGEEDEEEDDDEEPLRCVAGSATARFAAAQHAVV